ncbi:AI-2E family transporter [Nocardia cyriacigeorgica]|uniref:AI-2E family transporter n=1 Tax=Nocardia cyriacigeorgica TaxID=135487 RepID=UPI001894EC11|nr:AI-2E family transporter [Nocardia cyriacigeorgica]MBF6160490.1 AI-2E family transporter [Nocardia cyriacigeorgica]MBF6199743.1 AI-2E family transporter [Nocardia cyriacigeorgica]MBF6319958.1 AI-2E family transporter [Nocardia cyriacigeorgica]MBF6517184.1 AI-2E family transporter [Nocardia cyriacigeorgica]MBF6534376.1 AI-2E family transporter [Nocardia cyriacigeorgica]
MGAEGAPVAAGSPAPVWSIPRGLIVLLAMAGAVIAIAGATMFAGILGPVFLALMLTIAVQPVQGWARKRGWPAWLGMLVAVVAVGAILFGLIGALVVSVAQLATELPKYTDSLDDLLSGVREFLADAGVDHERISTALSSVDLGKLVRYLDDVLAGLLGVFSNLFFVMALLLFMAVDGMTIGRRMRIVRRVRPDIAYALTSFVRGTRRYLVVSTVFGVIVAVLDGGALWLLGVPLPVLWAVLSFITNYIPNIGFIIGLVPPALLALLDGGPLAMVWVIVVYSVINFVIQSIIQPKFVGDAVGLSVTVTFLSLVFWSWVLGALGALLAIPLTLLVKALLLDIDPSTRWVDALIGGGIGSGEDEGASAQPVTSTERAEADSPAADSE